MLKIIRRLISDTAVYGIGSAIERLIGFILLPLYTKFLSVGDYGTMAMLIIVIAVFRPLAALGMANSIFRYLSLYREGRDRNSVLNIGLISVIISSLVLCVIGVYFARSISVLLIGDDSYLLLVRLTVVSAMLGTIGDIPRVVLRAERRVKAVISLNCVLLLVSIPLTIFFVVNQKIGVLGVVLGWLIAEGVTTLLSLVLTVKKLYPVFEKAKLKQMLFYGAPFVPHRLMAVGMVYFGVYMVRHMLGIEDAGLYSIAVMLTAPLTLLVGTVQRAWVPLKFQIHSEENNPEEIFRSIVTYYVAVMLYLLVAVSAWAPELLRIFTEENFHRAAALIPVVALIPISSGIYWMIGTGFEMSDSTKSLPLVSFAGLMTLVILALLLVPQVGAFGAGIAAAAGWLVMGAAIYYCAQKRFPVKYDWRALGSLIGCALLMVLCEVWVQGAILRWRLFLAIAMSFVYPIFICLVLLQAKGERQRIQFLLLKLREAGT